VKAFVKSSFLWRVLLAALGLMLAGEVTAQTFTTLYNFTGGNDGGNPQAGLVLSGNTLYGTALYGGSLDNGTIFKLNTDGTGFTILHDFLGYPNDGANPNAGLILSGSTLFGATCNGGSSNSGALFAINADGTGLIILHSFPAPPSARVGPVNGIEGANPEAGLTLSGTTLYATTLNGGDGGEGVVFAVNTNGTGLTILHSFITRYLPVGSSDGNLDGANPQAALILSGDTLYGTAIDGGVGNAGTVFAVTTVSSPSDSFTTLHSFGAGSGDPLVNSDGANPQAGLILWGNSLYGTASAGCSWGNGTVFKLNKDGSGFTTLHAFNGSDGASPNAALVLWGSTLYGTTYSGGGSANGTVFALNVNGTAFTNLYNFTGGSDGANPQAALILAGNTLYGTTSAGGSSSFGTVFSLSLGPVNPPQLTIIPAGTNVVLKWTNTASGFTLQSTTNLGTPVWTTTSLTPVVVNGQLTLTNPISGTQQFFRLSQ
jgi:uncharacterized repeat protein (TIGR03803 family)